jgi:hypothetical protein
MKQRWRRSKEVISDRIVITDGQFYPSTSTSNRAKASRGWAHLEENTWGIIHTICLLFSERCTSLTRISRKPCFDFLFLFLVYEWKSKLHEWFLYPYDTECVCEGQVIWGFMCKMGAFSKKGILGTSLTYFENASTSRLYLLYGTARNSC